MHAYASRTPPACSLFDISFCLFVLSCTAVFLLLGRAGNDRSLHGCSDADAVRYGHGHGHGGAQARLRQHAHVRAVPSVVLHLGGPHIDYVHIFLCRGRCSPPFWLVRARFNSLGVCLWVAPKKVGEIRICGFCEAKKHFPEMPTERCRRLL